MRVDAPRVVVGHREHGLGGAAQLCKARVRGRRCIGGLWDGHPAAHCSMHSRQLVPVLRGWGWMGTFSDSFPALHQLLAECRSDAWGVMLVLREV